MAPDIHVTPHFVEGLDDLKQRLLTMGLLVEDRIRLAIRALVDRDASLTKRVIEGDGEINRLQVETTTGPSSCSHFTNQWPLTCDRFLRG
jgi:hypothetical protein